MKIINKILIATGLVVPVTVIYYFAYVSADKLFKDWCKANYCFEFPPYADVLAIYVAVIGLYFVVTSLDAWKHQDQYQTAKKNIEVLHSIYEKIKIHNVRLSNLEKNGMNRLIVTLGESKNTVKNTQLFYKYKSLLIETSIIDDLNEADYSITGKSKNLYQEDFNKVVGFANNYVFNIDSKIRKKDQELVKTSDQLIEAVLKKNGIDTETLRLRLDYNSKKIIDELSSCTLNLKQSDIDSIIKTERPNFANMKTELDKLQENLNKYIS